MAVKLDAAVREPAGARAWIVLYGNPLQPEVGSGENAGRSLRRDRVVRRLAGPLPASGALELGRDFGLRPERKRADPGAAAFVSDCGGAALPGGAAAGVRRRAPILILRPPPG